jgi:hypothetical protein
MYITPVEPPPPEVIGKKAELFGKRVPYVFQNYNKLWDHWYDKFQELGKEMEALKIPAEFPRVSCPMMRSSPSPRVTRKPTRSWNLSTPSSA